MQTNINIRVDSQLKEQAQDLFDNLGLDLTTAIRIFLNRSVYY
ncbi:MAG: type II toxin-antitoxin system RelB/DinJ family antitoxin [Ruminococcus sp.]|nr:type II toxin-antitoxin system RelB/DinJ family antitoxin [Ruminococcus sp.]